MSELKQGAARVGLVARGALYALLAVLALQVALGDKSTEADTQGALQAVASQPLGSLLVALLGVGFLAFAGWQARQLLANDDWPSRLRAGGRALLYLALAGTAGRLLLGGRSSGNEEQGLTARLLDTTVGPWLVGAFGVVVAVVALSFLRHIRGRRYLRDLRSVPPEATTVVSAVAVAGIGAKTTVYAMVGAFLVRAAVRHKANSGVGLDGALSRVAAEPYGTPVLIVVVIGLTAYAIWCAVRARYEDVENSDG